MTFDSTDGKRRILISNAAYNDLFALLKVLMIKHDNQTLPVPAVGPKVPFKPLLSEEVSEISPLRNVETNNNFNL